MITTQHVRPRGVATVVAALAAVALSLQTAQAQSAQPWSAQGSFLAASQDIGGNSVSGSGFEGQLRYTPLSVWSFGAGVQYTAHPSGGDEIKISGVFVEPRYVIDVGSTKFAPYLAGRLALLHESLDLASVPGSKFSSAGSAFGAGAGLLIRWTHVLNVDIGAALVRQKFSDASDAGTTVAFSAFTGYVAKAGFSIGFGKR